MERRKLIYNGKKKTDDKKEVENEK